MRVLWGATVIIDLQQDLSLIMSDSIEVLSAFVWSHMWRRPAANIYCPHLLCVLSAVPTPQTEAMNFSSHFSHGLFEGPFTIRAVFNNGDTVRGKEQSTQRPLKYESKPSTSCLSLLSYYENIAFMMAWTSTRSRCSHIYCVYKCNCDGNYLKSWSMHRLFKG